MLVAKNKTLKMKKNKQKLAKICAAVLVSCVSQSKEYLLLISVTVYEALVLLCCFIVNLFIY